MGISKSYLKDKFLSRGGNTRNNFSVKKSTITGADKGLFSNNPIPQGGFIGLAHENNQPVGTLGNMHNHSENPNMRSVKIGNQRYLYADRDITPGEELTTNYRFQPELEQPEDFMGAKRFAQKGTYQMGGETSTEENPKKIAPVNITASRYNAYKYNPNARSPLAKNYSYQDSPSYKKSNQDYALIQEAETERKRQEELKKFGESVFGKKPSPLEPVLKVVDAAAVVGDLATDVAQLGNFIPHPYAQAVGKAGNVLGAGIDLYQGARDVAKGNYGSAALNFGASYLPIHLSKKGYLRPISQVSNTYSGGLTYRPLNYLPGISPATKAAMSPYINTNRKVAGAILGETAYDAGAFDNNVYNTYRDVTMRDNTGRSFNPLFRKPAPVIKEKPLDWSQHYQMGGTKDSDYMNFVRTLPSNLAQPNDPSYNLKGYWDALGKPSSFDYTQPVESDGYYHAFSRDPRTGQILKAPFHPTFKMAIEEDRKAGYFPIVTPDNKIKTVSSSEYNNKTPTYDFLNKPNYEGYFQMGGTMSVPGVNGQVVSSGPQPLTSVKKTRGPISKDTKGDVKTMPTKAVKKILKNIK